MSHELSYDEAVALVAADVRQGYPELGYREAVAHAVATVALDSIYGDGQLEDAYRVVLARHVGPTRNDLVDVIKMLAAEADGDVALLSVQQRIWVELIQRDVPLS